MRRTVEAVWRIESARLIAALARVTGDVGLAEDLAQDALVAALERWPSVGVPDKPGAWLTAVARRRYVDGVRRQVGFERRVAEIGRELAATENQAGDPMDEREFDAHVDDDVLRLVFTACHPVLPRDGRVSLTLKLVGGLSTEQIARSFLVPVPTMAARITRAKRALREARVVFEVPVGAELAVRFADVLEVVYLIFNEGYAATSGESWYRADLCDEAMRLGRMLAALAPPPAAPEAHGLVALMEIQASRIPARTGPDGAPVTLLDQDRGRWNRLLITHGLAALTRANSLSSQPGAYVIQAELAACHARAFAAADTDWARIVTLYEALGRLTPSPVIELNRAVAVSLSDGPAAALVIVDALAADPALRGYHLLPAVRGDLLARLGRTAAARAAFESAAALTANASERDHLRRRAADRLGLDAGVRAVQAPFVADLGDLESRGRQHRLEQPAERAVLGAHVLGVLGGGVTFGRVGRGPGQPAVEDFLGLARPEVVHQVPQPQHSARAEHVGDPPQRDRLPEVGDLMERVPGEHAVHRDAGVEAEEPGAFGRQVREVSASDGLRPQCADHRRRQVDRDHPAEPPRRRNRELPGPRAEIDHDRRAVEAVGRERGDVRAGIRVPLLAVEPGDERRVQVLGPGVRRLVKQPRPVRRTPHSLAVAPAGRCQL